MLILSPSARLWASRRDPRPDQSPAAVPCAEERREAEAELASVLDFFKTALLAEAHSPHLAQAAKGVLVHRLGGYHLATWVEGDDISGLDADELRASVPLRTVIYSASSLHALLQDFDCKAVELSTTDGVVAAAGPDLGLALASGARVPLHSVIDRQLLSSAPNAHRVNCFGAFHPVSEPQDEEEDAVRGPQFVMRADAATLCAVQFGLTRPRANVGVRVLVFEAEEEEYAEVDDPMCLWTADRCVAAGFDVADWALKPAHFYMATLQIVPDIEHEELQVFFSILSEAPVECENVQADEESDDGEY
jgi:hypothetical protein